MKTRRDLKVWSDSINLVTRIYEITSTFPKEELFELTSQIRRASVSISSNIAEGAARNSKKEFNNFLSIALGSAAEPENQLIIASNLNYIKKDNEENFINDIINIRKMIHGLMKNLKQKF